MIPTSAILFLVLLGIACDILHAQVETAWIGCVDRANPDAKLQRLDKTSVCIVVSEGTNWATGLNYTRWYWTPTADQFSKFQLPGSYKSLVQDENKFKPHVSVHVSSQQTLSFIRRFYDEELGRIYPHLMAIVTVNEGVVTGIAWDDACIFCGGKVCAENSYNFSGNLVFNNKEPSKGCYVPKNQCDERGTEDKTCDLQIYVVWTGTDANGNVLTSANSRFSAFPSNQLMKSLWDFELPNIPGFS
mmetsp:Transcript_14491/g.21367  ORF Transcript_14491/g.21367 Transcript_14491/m.21367 type:complete len:245 (-) Transcript_14491:396-1130(-)|eukprot:CAMPEP_0195514210 /NCGR_PEP_ID=MMETSP0794_2-20130614/5662_1 /TAXON_ID=515487 /ORGANISM="Stephanopyxis turris, Strain CCMP 815" /LENGTH=244 /DNA_ID=CAMNT_0040642401 /DNA_START=65 /DNA_END=799 /DNA_ORIENTATION=+